MATISNIITRLNEMWSRVGKFSIGKDDFFELLSDLVNRQQATELNMSNLSIRKIYASVSAMNADVADPIGTDGEPILEGQLVAVSSSSEIYRYNIDSWELLGTIGDLGMYYTQSEIDVITNSIEQSAEASMAAVALLAKSDYNYRGYAEPTTDPGETSLIKDVFIARKDGDYVNFGISNVKKGQLLVKAGTEWIVSLADVVTSILFSEALGRKIVKMHSSSLNFAGFVFPNTSNAYKSIGLPDPSISQNAYITTEDGDYHDFGLTDVNAGEIIRPHNNAWEVYSSYTIEDLRNYII